MIHVRDSKVACEIIDVGTLGIGLLAPRDVAAGEFVRVVFRIGAANGPERLQQVDGVIVGSSPQGGGCRLGIQFTVIEGHVASQIHQYVAERVQTPKSQRRTGEYAPLESYPSGETPRGTGEYAAAIDIDEVEQDFGAATGTDGEDLPRGLSGLPIRGPERDAPIDHELLKLYLDAIRTVDQSRKKKS